MDRRDAMVWVLSVCTSLRLSQAKTLSVLVTAALALERVSLASLGRALGTGPEGSAKHAIKRCWRFIANDRVEPSLAMAGVVKKLLHKRKKPLVVALDWTDIRGLTTLMASVVVKGRSVPLVWASCPKNVWQGHKSRNSFEEALLLTLRHMIPRKAPVILLADRGFGRTELGRFCQNQGFHYVIRIQPKVKVRIGSREVRLDLYPVRRGICQLLKGVLYRENDPLHQNVVVCWKKNLPEKRDECWYLMSDLHRPAHELVTLYGKRMQIEQFFRDAKSKRNGWSLRDTGLTRPERLDRLILILALAYLLLVGLGLCAAGRFRSGKWASNNRDGEYSAFQIGQFMLDQLRLKTHLLLRAILANSEGRETKWG
jgi:Transposase DDE domain